jgi:endoglucanase
MCRGLTKRLVTGMIAAAALTAACTSGSGNSTGAPSPAGSSSAPSDVPTAPAAAAAFLDKYVEPDGRVIRHDQGGDIVSEGQAYAMLIAEIADRPAVVRTVWTWTRAHLQRSDGLLAFHAEGTGRILDQQPAADADVLAAYALLRYDGMDADQMHADGRRIARAVLAHEVTTDSRGRPVVVAGPWALKQPITVNPSYWMPGVFADIGRRTGDPRWSAMAEASVALARQLTDDGQRLPPDWAHLSGDTVAPAGAPSGAGGVQYGLDAMRTPAWFAAGCTTGARELAAQWWDSVLSDADQTGALALTLDGTVSQSATNPLPLIGAAAAADAAGERDARTRLVAAAARTAREHSTYYGDAWLALGTGLMEQSISECA